MFFSLFFLFFETRRLGNPNKKYAYNELTFPPPPPQDPPIHPHLKIKTNNVMSQQQQKDKNQINAPKRAGARSCPVTQMQPLCGASPVVVCWVWLVGGCFCPPPCWVGFSLFCVGFFFCPPHSGGCGSARDPKQPRMSESSVQKVREHQRKQNQTNPSPSPHPPPK